MSSSRSHPDLLDSGGVRARPSPADAVLTPTSPPPCRPLVRAAMPGDLVAMAALQIAELPLGLFPRLGARFVTRWHRAFLNSTNAVALVAVR